MGTKAYQDAAMAPAAPEAASAWSGLAAVLPPSVATELLTSGISVGTANTATNPLDVIKVRLQLTKKAAPSTAAAGGGGASGLAARPPGILSTGLGVVRREGVLALWSGLGPSLARGFFYGGARLGMYTPLKAAIIGDSKPSLEKKVLAGSLSGALAQAITSPIELMKTRLQAAGAAKAAAAAQAAAAAADSSAAPAAAAAAAAASGAGSTRVAASGAVGCPAAGPLIAGGSSAKPGPAAAVTAPPPRLPATTSLGVIREVVAADGVAGLWKGATPGLYRSAILTAAQCATYDEVKRGVSSATGWGADALGLHLASSMIAGLVTTTVTNPLDVIKTRMFVGGSTYSGVLSCAASVLRQDGLAGFMKGWSASYARLGPHTVIMFLAAEKLRSYAGLKAL